MTTEDLRSQIIDGALRIEQTWWPGVSVTQKQIARAQRLYWSGADQATLQKLLDFYNTAMRETTMTTACVNAGLDAKAINWQTLLAILQAILSLFLAKPPAPTPAVAVETHMAARHAALCGQGLWDYLLNLDYKGLLELFAELAAELTGRS